jgi:hypothetical protein
LITLLGHSRRHIHSQGSIDIARGSALECAAIHDVLVRAKGVEALDNAAMKTMLHRIVAMFTRMEMKFAGVAESGAAYDAEIDYDYEHRLAEYEHDSQTEETPE